MTGENRSIWEDDYSEPWQRDLLTLFVRNQLRVGLALPLLAIVFFATNLLWTEWPLLIVWLAAVFATQGVQLLICKNFQSQSTNERSLSDWIGMLAGSEFLFAAAWSMPLYLFWETGNNTQNTFIVAVLMAVVAVRIMIASNYMPVIIAGTGFIVFNIIIRCTIEAQPLYFGLGAMVFMTEIFFVQLAKRLQKTAQDMLLFKAQREQLIGELKQSQAEAIKGQQRAEVANKAKSQFLATMSHELRTPLNAIMGFSEILREELMGPHAVEAYKDYSGDIHDSGHYLLHLINDILDLSRIEAGKHEIDNLPVSLTAVADDCMRLMRMKLRDKNQTLVVELPKNTPKLCGDERSIRQIWTNLLTNANKFSGSDTTITMGVELCANNSLKLFVSDQGSGMDADEIKNVTGLFNRGASATKKAIEGSGLGLPIVNGLARLHNGEMSISSKKGKGTTVSVTFPPSRVLSRGQETVLMNMINASSTQKALISATAS